jgi:predicted MPP superfamily phosphohydrolase
MEFKLQFVSDIHLEISGKKPVIEKHAEYLALCGDIGAPKMPIYQEFLGEMSKMFSWVFVVAGNHEYYSANADMDEIDEVIRQKCALFPNVTYLQNSSHILTIGDKTFRFTGSTLWSNVGEAASYVVSSMNDYKKIRCKYWETNSSGQRTYKRFPIKPGYIVKKHNEAVQFISREIEEATRLEQRMIVLTHHLPTFRNIEPMYQNDPIAYAYASNLEHLIVPPVRAWLHGHSHYCTRTQINGVDIICNSFGYPNEKTGYRPDRVIGLC